jgi:hypothetical protein
MTEPVRSTPRQRLASLARTTDVFRRVEQHWIAPLVWVSGLLSVGYVMAAVVHGLLQWVRDGP